MDGAIVKRRHRGLKGASQEVKGDMQQHSLNPLCRLRAATRGGLNANGVALVEFKDGTRQVVLFGERGWDDFEALR